MEMVLNMHSKPCRVDFYNPRSCFCKERKYRQINEAPQKAFLTAVCCPKRDFYTHLPPRKRQQTFVLHTQNSMSFVLRTQKIRPIKVGKKMQQKMQQKRLQKMWQVRWENTLLAVVLKPV
jgi:hypothetical protein